MRRSWQWLLVGRLVVMIAFSPMARASEAGPAGLADEAVSAVTYTPTVAGPSSSPVPSPVPAGPARTAPAPHARREADWTAIEELPPLTAAAPAWPLGTARYGDDDERPFGSAKQRFMGNSGICSVVGLIGITYTYSPVQLFQIELGSGLGFSGFQFSLMPKLSLGDDHHRFVLGVGPSVGIARDSNPSYTYLAYWLNAEVGYEYRSAGGFSFLIAAGVFHGIGGEYRDECMFDCDGDTHGWPEPTTAMPFLPQGRIAFGRWF
jgi:hypothetical protein